MVYLLRLFHGVSAIYFIACLIYIYYAAFFSKFDLFLLIALVSLGIEGFVVFILNKGDCPLIYVQRKINDDKPFFELFLPPGIAKKAVPFFARITWIAIIFLIIRLIYNLFLN
jgi:hypothetical protein